MFEQEGGGALYVEPNIGNRFDFKHFMVSSYVPLNIGPNHATLDCTDHLGKEPYRQVDKDRLVTSGTLGGIMVGTLARNARHVGSIPVVGAIHPIFINLMTTSKHNYAPLSICSRTF